MKPLTNAMLRELKSLARTGEPSDLYDWPNVPGALAFHARDRVLGALLRRGLIQDAPGGYELTPAGKGAVK